MITSLAIGRGGLGRFGNNCFTIAGCIGITVRSGQPYAFPEWKTLDNEIFGQPIHNVGAELLSQLPVVPNIMFQEYGYFWGYRQVYLPTGNWSVDGHMQSDKFFSHCISLIRQTFTFKNEPPQNEFVAIHWRAGDYIDDENAHHPRLTKDYYDKALALFPDDNFYLFSDDIEAAAKMFIGNDRVTIIDYKDYIAEFKLMKKCKSFICANSSFSLFAAILGDHPEKKIICPAKWFGKGMPAEFDTKDIYPENAIII